MFRAATTEARVRSPSRVLSLLPRLRQQRRAFHRPTQVWSVAAAEESEAHTENARTSKENCGQKVRWRKTDSQDRTSSSETPFCSRRSSPRAKKQQSNLRRRFAGRNCAPEPPLAPSREAAPAFRRWRNSSSHWLSAFVHCANVKRHIVVEPM